MRAAWYEKQGPARDVLVVGDMPDPTPGVGEVRVRVAASGVNPGDAKKRADAFGFGMADPRIVPHSDGAGVVDAVGAGVDPTWTGRRVWIWGAQTYRVFGTAAERVVVPADQVVPLADHVPFDVGACLGIPGITAHRAVGVAGPVAGRTVLVQGGAGAVATVAVGLAARAGARVVATVRRPGDEAVARAAGAHDVVVATADGDAAAAIRAAAPGGVQLVVEVDLAANARLDADVLADGGAIAVYATSAATASVPVWPLVFVNAAVHFVGSDDVPRDAKRAAVAAVDALVRDGWRPVIAARFPLEEIAAAHEAVERPTSRGRVVVNP